MTLLPQGAEPRSSRYFDVTTSGTHIEADFVELALESWNLSLTEPPRVDPGSSVERWSVATHMAQAAGYLASTDPADEAVPDLFVQANVAVRDGADLGAMRPTAALLDLAGRLWPTLTPTQRSVLVSSCQHTIRGNALCLQFGPSQAGSAASTVALLEMERGVGFRAALEEYDLYGGWVGGTVAAAQLYAISDSEYRLLADPEAAAVLADQLLDWIDDQVRAARAAEDVLDVLAFAHRLYMRESLVWMLLEALCRAGVPTSSVAISEMSHMTRLAEEHRVEYATLLRHFGRRFFEIAWVDPDLRLEHLKEFVGNVPIVPSKYIDLVRQSAGMVASDLDVLLCEQLSASSQLYEVCQRRRGIRGATGA